MRFPWTIKRKMSTPAEKKIELIIAALFPKWELHSQPDEKGKMIKFHVDRAVDTNLDAVLVDLQEGHNDVACHETLNDVIKRLSRVRHLLQAYSDFDKDAQYIIVENESDTRINWGIEPADF
jgi:hypothetical protein